MKWVASAPNDSILAAGQVGLRRRFWGFLIDLVVISLLSSVTASAFSLTRDANAGLFWLLYLVYFTGSYALGATVGMLAVGARVIGLNGERIGVLTALLRSICVLVEIVVVLSIIGAIAFYIYRAQGRPYWHDQVTKSFVVRKASLAAFATVSRLDRSLPVEPRAHRPKFGPRVREREMKKCPECAELVLSEARICRYCRHEFVPRVA
jgi:uncharacterized RDD family membrane protein YckC